MAGYVPTITDSSRLKHVFDADGGLYTDAGKTTVANTNGAIILASKSALGESNDGAKAGSGNMTWQAIGPNNRPYCVFPGTNAMKWTTGSIDPAAFTVFVVYRPKKRVKAPSEMLLCPGLSAGGAGTSGKACDIAQFNGQYNVFHVATNYTLTGLIAPCNTWMVFAVRSDSTGIRMYRDGEQGPSSVPAMTSDATLVGQMLCGRNAADIWLQGDVCFMSSYNGTFTDLEFNTELAALKAYYAAPDLIIANENLLVIDGDSNSTAIGATNVAGEWGTVLAAQLAATGVQNLIYRSEGCASRTLASLTAYRQTLAWRLSTARAHSVYILMCGENDLINTAGATVFNNAKAQMQYMKLNTPFTKLVLVTPPPRNDGGGSYVANITAFNNALAADPTMGGILDGIIDVGGDSILGPSTSAANTTWYPDGTHLNNIGCARMATGALDITGLGKRGNAYNVVYPMFMGRAGGRRSQYGTPNVFRRSVLSGGR